MVGRRRKLTMRILMIVPEPFFTPRGTPISVLMRARALSSLGHEIHVLTYPVGKDVRIRGIRIHRSPRVPFINHVPIGLSCRKIILDAILFLFTIFFSFKQKYECIHAHEEGAFIGVILKKIFGKSLIYDMHSSIPDHVLSFTRSRHMTYFGVIIQKWIVKNSDIIIVISSSLVREVNEISADKNIFLIENIPIFEDAPVSEESLKKLRKELDVHDENVVLYTGTFEPYQGLDILLRAIPRVVKSNNNVKFIMVGGETGQIYRMKKLAESLNVTNYVTFTGPRPLSEMPLFMAIAHVLVSPRTKERENPPLKLYSYLKSRVPIVATNVPANTQVLTNETSVLTDPEPDSFSKGIISLLEDEELRNRIVRNLKEVEFDHSEFQIKLGKAYSSLEQSVPIQYQ